MKVVCFVLFVLMRSTKRRCFRSHSWSLWKAIEEEGCTSLVSWCFDLWWKNSRIWLISSLKIKLNPSWKFRRKWNVHLVLLERSWWAGFNGIYLVRIGFKMWEILIFKWFLPLKIQINFKKPSFGRKNQLRTWYTWANNTSHTNLSMKEGILFCFVVMRSTELGCFRLCSWCLWKALDEEGCMGLVPWHLNLLYKSSWILNDFFTKN